MLEYILGLLQQYPQASAVFAVIGLFRVVFKPIMSVWEAWVGYTPQKSDNEVLNKFKKGPIYKALIWLVDYSTSIKLPK
jgi:hypothetical protein